MRTNRFLALVAAITMIAAACGGGSDEASSPGESPAATAVTTTATPTTTTPPTTVPVPEGGTTIQGLHIDRVVFGTDGFVEISNSGDSDVSLDGLWLCQFPNYLPLSGTIAAGDVLQIEALGVGGLSSSGGEAALYSAREFDSAKAILDYVGWGTGGKRGEVAAQAGIWPQGVTVSAPSDFIELGGAPGDPEAWG